MSGTRHPYLDWPGPIPFAHRGGAWEAPENTLPAFERSLREGYRHLETDVHVSRDGVVFAFHDGLLDRVTDRRGRIEALPAAEIEAADAGWAWTPDGGATFPFRGRGVRVPRLAELLERWPEVRVNIDPKHDSAVAPLAGVLERMDAWSRTCVGAFSDARLARIRVLSRGRACTSMGPRAVATARLASYRGRMPRLGADCVQVPMRAFRVRLVDPAFVAAAHRSGLPVHVWTVDDEATIERLLDLGVDGVMTDRPVVLREVLRRRGAWYGG